MRHPATLLLCALTLATPALAQSKANAQQDEQAIRAQSNRWVEIVNSGRRPSDLWEAGGVFVSGVFPRPVIIPDTAMKPRTTVQAEKRKNQRITQTIRRVTVSEAGDMAWEYTDFESEYDATSTGKHVTFPGSMLRVWHKVDGQWKMAAMFARPNGDE
jgi:ketosteroid isomerase-like protein